jgi:branched-chain amino acid transport system substrate-binding protein
MTPATHRRTTILSQMLITAVVAAAFSFGGTVGRAQSGDLKIGLVGPFSGPSAAAAQQVLDGFMLGIETFGGKLGGLNTTVLREDDQLKPDVALQAVNKLIERDKVDVIVGPQYSNTMLASQRTITDAKVLNVSAVAGPSLIAGKQCSPYFFATSFQNDEAHEVMGLYLTGKGIKRVYLLAPNYPAGRDALTGFKRTFKGEIVGEVYTPLSQLDFAAEISQIKQANPDAVYVFYPATFGINFHKQYGQSGLIKDIPLYSSSSVDEASLVAIGDAAIGTFQATSWNFDTPVPANKKFTDAFVERFKYRPSFISAYAFDAAQLLNAALTEVKANLADKPGLIAAMEKADFSSVRGAFKFASNHIPIQNWDLVDVVKDGDGKLVQKTLTTMQANYVNAYVKDCNMPKP